MSFEGLTCTHCLAQMHWNGTDKIIKCDFCGTEYAMHPREGVGRTVTGETKTGGQGAERPSGKPNGSEEKDETRLVTVGRGRVDYVVAKGEQGPHFSLFIPKGWNVRVDPLANVKRINMYSPAPFSVVLESPEGDALISINSDQIYQHQKANFMNQQMQFQTNIYDFKIYAEYKTAAEYLHFLNCCDSNIQDFELLNSASQPTSQPEKAFAARQQEILQRYRKLFRYVDSNWARNSYRVLNNNGRTYYRTMEVIVNRVTNGTPDEGAPQGFGRWFLNSFAAMQNPILWEVHRQVVLTATRERYTEALEYYKQVRDTFDETPKYREFEKVLQQYIVRSKMQTDQHIANVQAQMAQDNINHMNRTSAIINSTNDYTNDIMRQMREDNSASMDRVRNLQSESIRGVNTYHTNDGRVAEASINWDHVYQSNVNPDNFMFTSGTSFEPGVDFDELNRTNGDY